MSLCKPYGLFKLVCWLWAYSMWRLYGLLGNVLFLFFKIVFYSQKQEKQEHVWFIVFFFIIKTQRTQKLVELLNEYILDS